MPRVDAIGTQVRAGACWPYAKGELVNVLRRQIEFLLQRTFGIDASPEIKMVILGP